MGEHIYATVCFPEQRSLLKSGLLLKERICSYGSKFFRFKFDPDRKGGKIKML